MLTLGFIYLFIWFLETGFLSVDLAVLELRDLSASAEIKGVLHDHPASLFLHS